MTINDSEANDKKDMNRVLLNNYVCFIIKLLSVCP